MSFASVRVYLVFLFLFIVAGCAQIVPPQGGSKDTSPPVLLSVSPADSQLHIRPSRIELRFDEYIVVSNPSVEVSISPLLRVPLNVEALSRKVIVRIPDSLLEDNTTYRIQFGKAIRDLHEDNPFPAYDYTFSTGGYFDTLRIDGFVFNAATGQRDTGAVVILHPANRSDSAIVRDKPMYRVKADESGTFSFTGLPARPFRIYALRDENDNLVFDGGTELVGFLDTVVVPGDKLGESIVLRMFGSADSSAAPPATAGTGRAPRQQATAATDVGFAYQVQVDTTDIKRRTFGTTQPLKISFNRMVKDFNPNRINLSYDSLGTQVEAAAALTRVAGTMDELQVAANWQQNAVYTLRLLKGFAQDSTGGDAPPGRYSFRTKREEDYAKLHIHLPGEYARPGHVLEVLRGADTVYHRPVTDSVVHLSNLEPGSYTFRIIKDRNGNGKWDTGDLLKKLQAEEVIPYSTPVNLKAGWENLVDFGKEGRQPERAGASVPGRGAPR